MGGTCCIAGFNTGISTPLNPHSLVTQRRLCSGQLRLGSASAQVCLGLLNISPEIVNFNKGAKKAPSSARGSQICSHCNLTFTTCASQNSFPDSYRRLPVVMQNAKTPIRRDLFCVLIQRILRRPQRAGLEKVLISPACSAVLHYS